MCAWEAFSSLADVPFWGYHPVCAIESVILPVAVAVKLPRYELSAESVSMTGCKSGPKRVIIIHYLRMQF